MGKVTIWPETAEAVVIPGIATEPDGMFPVETDQLDGFELTVKPVGNTTCILLSVPEVCGIAHTMPPVEREVAVLSVLTITPKSPAYTLPGRRGRINETRISPRKKWADFFTYIYHK